MQTLIRSLTSSVPSFLYWSNLHIVVWVCLRAIQLVSEPWNQVVSSTDVTKGGFICTFSLLIFLSITLQTSKFRNQFKIFWYGVLPIMRDLFWSYLFWGSAKWQLITFNHLRCHSSSRALGTRTGYWKPTQRGTDETPQNQNVELLLWGVSSVPFPF